MRSTPENSLAAPNCSVPSSLGFFEGANEIQASGRPEAMTPPLAAGEQ